MVRGGLVEYLSDPWNYADILYIMGSFANIGLQNWLGPWHTISRVCMSVIVCLLITKTFFFLRIFQWLSYIVTMIYTVVSDLKVFALFFTILIVLFSMVFAVLGAGNQNVPGEFQEMWNEAEEAGEADVEERDVEEEDVCTAGLGGTWHVQLAE